MHISQFLRSLLFILLAAKLFLANEALACIREAPVVHLKNNIRIEVAAQSGLRLSGKNSKPTVVRIKAAKESEYIPLKVETLVTEVKNTATLWKRATGASPEYQDIELPYLIELQPERIPEHDLNYVIDLQEENTRFQIEVLFRGGISKSRGCGSEAIVTPLSSKT